MDLELTYLAPEQYNVLTFILGNRAVNEKHVKRLRLEIEHNDGQIPARRDWILIINDKNEIIDGQCHWEAIRQYNARHPNKTISTVACTIESGAGLDRAKEINNCNTKWQDKDYVYSWIRLGHASYIFLDRVMNSGLMKRAGGLKIVLSVCMGFDTPALKNKFHKGEFVMNRRDEDALELLGYLARCRERLHKAFGHYNYAAPVFFKCLLLRDACADKDIDRDRLEDTINKVKINCSGLVNGHKKKFKFSDDQTDILNDIHIAYNYGLSVNDLEYFDIFNAYKDLDAHNHQQERNVISLPMRRNTVKTPDISAAIKQIKSNKKKPSNTTPPVNLPLIFTPGEDYQDDSGVPV